MYAQPLAAAETEGASELVCGFRFGSFKAFLHSTSHCEL